MKQITLFAFLLLFGIVKPKAQQTAPTSENATVKVLSFEFNFKDNKTWLEWTVNGNDITDRFEVERSFNGKDFKTSGVVFASEKKGSEQYAYFETTSKMKKVFYRLKLIDKKQQVVYSTTVITSAGSAKDI